MASLKRAFTLIELLIVVAIIAILAAIAVPNFLEAQIRSKVSRVRTDMRTMATALESYAVDNNKYPIRRDRWMDDNPPARQMYPPFREKICIPGQPNARAGLHTITTPVSYLTSLPVDVFNNPAKGLATPDNTLLDVIDYWDPEQTDAWVAVPNGKMGRGRGKGWMLVSVGPDQRMGVVSVSGNPGGYPPETPASILTGRIFYDSTNGSVSIGNLYRSQGDMTERDVLWSIF